MVSASGEKKENKKVAPSTQKPATANSPQQTIEGKSPTPKGLTRKSSNTSIFQEVSEKQETSANIEPVDISTFAPLKKTSSRLNVTGRSPTPSDASMYAEAQPQPPPTHFAPVVVTIESALANTAVFTGLLKLNRNMVIRQVKRELMSLFIPGDQICSVNGVTVWNRSHLVVELKNAEAAQENKTIEVTVIRAWNIFPPPADKLEKLLPPPDDRHQYFCVRVQFKHKYQGFSIYAERKKILIAAINSKSAASYSFLVGDQLLAIGDEMLVSKGKKMTANYVRAVVTKQVRGTNGVLTVFASRQLPDRSSPNPSVDAELAERRFGTSEVSGKSEKKTRDFDEVSPPLEGDALEIALREMCCLQQAFQANNQMPPTSKSRSLLRGGTSGTTQSVMTAPTCPAEKSLYGLPTATSSLTCVVGGGANTPKKPKKQQKKAKKPQKTIEIREATETEKITSDIPEDEDLKKCDPRSGIVAYIRNAFNN